MGRPLRFFGGVGVCCLSFKGAASLGDDNFFNNNCSVELLARRLVRERAGFEDRDFLTIGMSLGIDSVGEEGLLRLKVEQPKRRVKLRKAVLAAV